MITNLMQLICLILHKDTKGIMCDLTPQTQPHDLFTSVLITVIYGAEIIIAKQIICSLCFLPVSLLNTVLSQSCSFHSFKIHRFMYNIHNRTQHNVQ